MLEASVLLGFVSPASALVGIWFGGYLNQRNAVKTAEHLLNLDLKKYYKNKVFDIQREIFSDFFSKWHKLHNACTLLAYHYKFENLDKNSYFGKDKYIEHLGGLSEKFGALNEVFENNLIYLGDDFVKEYVKWRGSFLSFFEGQDPEERAQMHLSAINSHADDLKIMAKKKIFAA
ncbi:hypothetical protein [Novosphingobium rosa]|uniref:hypothetical protein n=1 Tax=Novosphingobium rosa TaxID=76978 RepID=UPI0012EE9647|nr:hypothetical protein [Novosphingobium rosa]